MYHPAKIVIELKEDLAHCPNTWKNMIISLNTSNSMHGITIDQLRKELSKFDADYDGSPYVFFRNEKKYLLWQLTYSNANNDVDMPS
jgi:hypothetical protein